VSKKWGGGVMHPGADDFIEACWRKVKELGLHDKELERLVFEDLSGVSFSEAIEEEKELFEI